MYGVIMDHTILILKNITKSITAHISFGAHQDKVQVCSLLNMIKTECRMN